MAETTTLEAAVYTSDGAEHGRVALPPALFDGVVNMPVMHQAVKAFLANQRQGNASTKTRGRVVGGNQKPWKQKGTGRARQGSTRAPHWVGGGTVFGPQPRSYAQYVPKQVRQLARKSALNARAREGALFVVDPLTFDVPKTSRVVALIGKLGLDGQKVLILTDGVKSALHLSARNLPTVHVMPYADVSTYHLLWSDAVVIEAPAIGQEPTGVSVPAAQPAEADEAAPRARTATKKSAAKKKPAAKKAAAKAPAAKKAAAKKSAARKSAATNPAAKKTAAKKAPARKAAAKKKPRGK
jgi:large subunit ribosomal protein L4